MDISFNNYFPIDSLELNAIKVREQQEGSHLSQHVSRSAHAMKEGQVSQAANIKAASLLSNRECLQNLSIIGQYVDSLISQQSNTLYSLLSKHNTHRSNSNQKRDSSGNDEHEAENPEQIGQRLVGLLISIFEYIQKCRLFDDYKLYALYKNADATTLYSRQMIVVVPFVDAKPSQGNVYFLEPDLEGGVRRCTLPIQISQVGYHYNSDWLTIESKETMGSSLARIVLQTHEGLLIDGYCISSQSISDQSEEHNYLYIEGFNKAWNSISDTSNV